MSGVDSRRYQPRVEDWDEDAENPCSTTRSNSGATANVAVKRNPADDFDPSPAVHYGTDSGYVSQAPTISSKASTSHRREFELKPNIIERERKPYAIATTREFDSSTMSKPVETKPIKKPAFCHKTGICWVCDKYGHHFDPKDLPKKEIVKPTPTPPVAAPKREVPKPKTEERPLPRRMSSNQRPISMYAAMPVQPPYQQYTVPLQAWPISTQPPPPQPVQPQYTYYIPPVTPVYNMAHPQQPQTFYYDPQPVYEEYPTQSKPSRRTSMIVSERPKLEKRPSRTHTMMERPVSREMRPQLVTQQSRDMDRAAMPPPPKPVHAIVNTARPRTDRASTYHTTSKRHSHHEEDSDDEYTAYKEPPSPSRPPSSYRKVTQEVDRPKDVVRPRLQEKASSYQQPNPVQVAARGVPRRRTTESAPAKGEQALANAEAYIRRQGSNGNDLTAENLKEIAARQNDQRSDTGSTGSHLTHHSGSKDSSNSRGRGSTLGHARMNISFDGVNLNITNGGIGSDGPPVRIDLGGIQLSMNHKDKENVDYRPKQKQLERAPSMSSRPSRRSLTNTRQEQLAIEAPDLRLDRHPSYVDEDERDPSRRNSKSSRQASRNTSHTRQPQFDDMSRPRQNRSSVDYSLRREDPPVM